MASNNIVKAYICGNDEIKVKINKAISIRFFAEDFLKSINETYTTLVNRNYYEDFSFEKMIYFLFDFKKCLYFNKKQGKLSFAYVDDKKMLTYVTKFSYTTIVIEDYTIKTICECIAYQVTVFFLHKGFKIVRDKSIQDKTFDLVEMEYSEKVLYETQIE